MLGRWGDDLGVTPCVLTAGTLQNLYHQAVSHILPVQ